MNREKFYKTTATPYTWTASDPDTYGSEETYTEGDSFLCAFDQDSGSKNLVNQKETEGMTHYLECPLSVTLTTKDRVLINSNYYDILNIDNPMDMSVCQEVSLRLRK